MTPVLIAAVVLVGALFVLNLTLTLGVIKRLREHTELLSNLGGPPAIAMGQQIEAFAATTVDGEQLSNERLAGDETLVAFFSPTCQPCIEKLPRFVDFATKMPGGRDRVLAVVIGDHEESSALVDALNPVAKVAVENTDGVLSTAFKVKAYPTTLMIASNGRGRLVVTANHVDLDKPVAAV